MPIPNRQLVGPWIEAVFTFQQVDTSLVAGTALPRAGALGTASPPMMLWDGIVVGIGVGCEASSNFTLEVDIDGTPDTGSRQTVNAAGEYFPFNDAEKVEFTAGQTVGVKPQAVTTAKDVVVDVYVLLNIGEGSA